MRVNFFPYRNLWGYVYKFTRIREEIHGHTHTFSREMGIARKQGVPAIFRTS